MKFDKRTASMAVALWVFAIGVGTVWVMDFAARPGEQAVGPEYLPADAFENRDQTLPTLALFVHPHCSCSRATLKELARLVARTEGLMNIYVLFYKPPGKASEWVESNLWHLASEIPDVEMKVVDKREVKRFGATTSGHAMLFDANGKQIFSGGITNARAHEGDNLGRSTIQRYLNNGEIPARHSSVFGCALTSEHEELRQD